MCAPTVVHELAVEHDAEGRWTVRYVERDLVGGEERGFTAGGNTLTAALLTLAKRCVDVQPVRTAGEWPAP